VIESVSFKGPSATIKTHHNVGGLPPDVRFKAGARCSDCRPRLLRGPFKATPRRTGNRSPTT